MLIPHFDPHPLERQEDRIRRLRGLRLADFCFPPVDFDLDRPSSLLPLLLTHSHRPSPLGRFFDLLFLLRLHHP